MQRKIAKVGQGLQKAPNRERDFKDTICLAYQKEDRKVLITVKKTSSQGENSSLIWWKRMNGWKLEPDISEEEIR